MSLCWIYLDEDLRHWDMRPSSEVPSWDAKAASIALAAWLATEHLTPCILSERQLAMAQVGRSGIACIKMGFGRDQETMHMDDRGLSTVYVESDLCDR